MHTLRRGFGAIGLLFLVVTTGWTQPSFFVLCIAPDGHVVIEPGQERCGPVGDAAQDSAPTCEVSAPLDACCTPCADLPLESPVLARANGSKHHLDPVQTANAPAWVGSPMAGEAWTADARAVAGAGLAISSSGPAPKTVVLRC